MARPERATRRAAADASLLRRTGLRLGLQAAAIVSVIVVVLTATAVMVVLRSQRAEATALLEQANARAIDVIDPPAGVYLVAHTADGRVLTTPGLPAGLAGSPALARTEATGQPEAFDLHLRNREYAVQTVHRADGVTLEAILDLGVDHGERDQLVTAMLVSGGFGLLLAVAAGAWLGVRATRPLSTALALQQRFVSDASHELRTPLTLLSTRAQLLRRRLRGADLPADLLDTAGRVVTDSERLAAILDDLLLAANPAAQDRDSEINLTDLATDIVTEAQPRSSPDHAVRITGPAAAPGPRTAAARDDTTVLGSPIALRRAVTALLDNATRHARTSVQVSVHRTPRHVVLEVRDDGPGVDPALAPRLFQRFASTRTPGPDGRRHYGLGLALVSETVAAHHGAIELVEPDRPGATFRVTLPPRRRSPA
jgi:two-component system, OmpR family, sensor kinase